MNVLMIGDIVAKPGRKLVEMFLPSLIEKHNLDFVVANVENIAHGFGVTPETADELLRMGTDVLTSGNHIWDKKEIMEYINSESRLLRPANYPKIAPGKGHLIALSRNGFKVGVLNVQGRVFMGPSEDPFSIGLELVEQIRKETPIILVDMHGEASSEKQAMGWFLDGKVTAVCGTHTHVPTADQRILPGGTAYVTDIGMTGPYDSIIGVEKDQIIQKFLDQIPVRFEPAKENPILQAMLIQVEDHSGLAQKIQRITVRGED
ncbi:TIGR00282 family metallophosphoesterase [bacterium]|nr:TIGR00282 family metallophosphoesterase [bacterium]